MFCLVSRSLPVQQHVLVIGRKCAPSLAVSSLPLCHLWYLMLSQPLPVCPLPHKHTSITELSSAAWLGLTRRAFWCSSISSACPLLHRRLCRQSLKPSYSLHPFVMYDISVSGVPALNTILRGSFRYKNVLFVRTVEVKLISESSSLEIIGSWQVGSGHNFPSCLTWETTPLVLLLWDSLP